MLTLISFILVLVGALNWFSIGALQYDFVAGVFGSQASMLSRLIYFAIGLAGMYLIAFLVKKRGSFRLTGKFADDDVLGTPKKSKNNIETDFEFKFNDEENARNNAQIQPHSTHPVQTFKDFDESQLDI